jgi:hypothetical protein
MNKILTNSCACYGSNDIHECYCKPKDKAKLIIRKVFNGIAVNYVQVDRSKSIVSIKHKINIKTAIFGELYHPYNPEMKFI